MKLNPSPPLRNKLNRKVCSSCIEENSIKWNRRKHHKPYLYTDIILMLIFTTYRRNKETTFKREWPSMYGGWVCSIVENLFRIHLRHTKPFHDVYLLSLSAKSTFKIMNLDGHVFRTVFYKLLNKFVNKSILESIISFLSLYLISNFQNLLADFYKFFKCRLFYKNSRKSADKSLWIMRDYRN